MIYLYILGPSCLGLLIYYMLLNKGLKFSFKSIFEYVSFVVVNNLITYGIYLYIFKKVKNIYDMKYLLYSSIVAIALAIIVGLINKNIQISLEVVRNVKRDKEEKNRTTTVNEEAKTDETVKKTIKKENKNSKKGKKNKSNKNRKNHK